jgi:hypothetical protein
MSNAKKKKKSIEKSKDKEKFKKYYTLGPDVYRQILFAPKYIANAVVE